MAFLSRISLRRDGGSTGTLIELLRRDRGLGGEHKLVWTLFSEASGAPRDFLFRRGERDGWLSLSQREPVDRHNIWEIETKRFDPTFAAGQQLAFRLRANPRISVRDDKGKSIKHDAVTTYRLKMRDPDGSIPSVADALPEASYQWLSGQGERSGFTVERSNLVSDCYVQQTFPSNSGGQVRFRSLDFCGILTVADADQFASSVLSGFGGGRAYGFGMMLLTRV